MLTDIQTYRCSIQDYEDGEWAEVNAPCPSDAAEQHVERWDRQTCDYLCAGKGQEVVVIVLMIRTTSILIVCLGSPNHIIHRLIANLEDL